MSILPAGYLAAWLCRAVFYDDNFEVAGCLPGKACQEVVDFVNPVIDRHYDRIFFHGGGIKVRKAEWDRGVGYDMRDL